MPRSKSARKREWHGETHASRGSSEFRIWMQMIGRCTTPTHRRFADYGGRGIQVCERWLESVTNFIADMGRRPSADHQLERKDNDGPYAPHNCVWATRTEQGRNKRNNVLMTLAGRTQPMSAWAEELKLPYSTLRRRKARLGWSDEEALMTPVGGATSERRRAAKAQLTAAQTRALELAAARSVRGVELTALGCDYQKLAGKGLIAKCGPGKNDPFAITQRGMQALADARIEIGAAP